MKLLNVILVLLVAATATAGQLTENIKVKGDFRLRHEMIDKEGSEIRNRQRFRTRLGMAAQGNEDIKVNFGIASGGDHPTSTNQTLGDGFTSKSLMIDIASFDYAVAQDISFTGGKMKNPFYTPAKTQLIWDGDLRPEGVVFNYNSGAVFASSGAFSIDERSDDINAALYAAQAGMSFDINSMELKIGGSWYNYSKLFDSQDYNLNEFFGVLNSQVGGKPASLFVDYSANSKADTDDTGFLYGVKLGKAKNVGSWDAQWSYRKVEANSVYGAFDDGDFAGGQTGCQGHKVNFGYMFGENAKFGFTYFMNEKIEDGATYNRFQADIKLKF
ncbi:hypothetical protein HOD41_04455 [bacterium]|nr:hypothetical protein [bacterium]